MEKNFESMLGELYAEIRAMNLGPLPRFLSMKRAAREMDISTKKLRVMIDAGQIAYQMFGDRIRIPLREIERLEREAKPKSRPGPKPKPPATPKPRGSYREFLKTL
jgi:excisionase family DNA binding protein